MEAFLQGYKGRGTVVQVKIVGNSSSIWTISPPSRDLMTKYLSDNNVTMRFSYEFTRCESHFTCYTRPLTVLITCSSFLAFYLPCKYPFQFHPPSSFSPHCSLLAPSFHYPSSATSSSSPFPPPTFSPRLLTVSSSSFYYASYPCLLAIPSPSSPHPLLRFLLIYLLPLSLSHSSSSFSSTYPFRLIHDNKSLPPPPSPSIFGPSCLQTASFLS